MFGDADLLSPTCAVSHEAVAVLNPSCQVFKSCRVDCKHISKVGPSQLTINHNTDANNIMRVVPANTE